MTKSELRKLYKEKRKSISYSEKLKLDDLMLLQFQQLYFETGVTLFSYLPMEDLNEPNTFIFSSFLNYQIPELQIAYPKVDFESNTMQAIAINDDTVYVSNKFGTDEPKDGKLIKPLDVDIVFVPLLVCDMQGYRVGYGKGFYDKYLAQCKDEAIFIGLNYFEPLDKIEDVDEFDIPLNYCITPHNIYEF